ncbi:hypothetical protein AHAS_Ahas17G0196400 [Arachis hypogaea]
MRDLPVPSSGSGRALYSRPVSFRTFFSFSVTNLNPSSIEWWSFSSFFPSSSAGSATPPPPPPAVTLMNPRAN